MSGHRAGFICGVFGCPRAGAAPGRVVLAGWRSSAAGGRPGDPSKGLQVDGIFGPETDAAVRGFQQALHLDIPSVTVDGIVGPVTWQALVSGMLSL